jgi:hypothetical protein
MKVVLHTAAEKQLKRLNVDEDILTEEEIALIEQRKAEYRANPAACSISFQQIKAEYERGEF